jgi:hypothetical protein
MQTQELQVDQGDLKPDIICNSDSSQPKTPIRRVLFGGLAAGLRRHHADESMLSEFQDLFAGLRLQDKIEELRVRTERDARSVVDDTEEFRRMQEILRDEGVITDSVLKLKLHKILRQCVSRMEQRKRQQEESNFKTLLSTTVYESEFSPTRSSPKSVVQFAAMDGGEQVIRFLPLDSSPT